MVAKSIKVFLLKEFAGKKIKHFYMIRFHEQK